MGSPLYMLSGYQIIKEIKVWKIKRKGGGCQKQQKYEPGATGEMNVQ